MHGQLYVIDDPDGPVFGETLHLIIEFERCGTGMLNVIFTVDGIFPECDECIVLIILDGAAALNDTKLKLGEYAAHRLLEAGR